MSREQSEVSDVSPDEADRSPGPKPGRRATIKDIAADLGISHTTVSRALADHRHTSAEMKALVREAAARQGYIPSGPARLMRTAQSTLLGLVVPTTQNEFYGSAAKVMAQKCAEIGYQLVLMITDDDPELEYRQVQALCQARATGVAIALTAAPLPETIALLKQMPAVQAVRSHANLAMDAVVVDDRRAMRLSMAHLLEGGHRRIAYLGISRLHSVGAERWAGVCEALAEAGLSEQSIAAEFTGPHSELPAEIVGRLMVGAPSALLLGGTSFTIPALSWIQEKGLRLPDDLSLTCCGDAEWLPFVGPGLTTISLGAGETAAACASLLIERVRGDARKPQPAREAVFISIPPTLVVRGSTGHPSRP